MRTTMFRITLMLAVVMAFASVSTYGQTVIKQRTFVVPFEFSFGDKVLPAGEYVVTAETQIVRIQNKEGKGNAIALAKRSDAKQKTTQAKLSFNRYGEEYQLAQVWLDDGVGREFKTHRHDRFELAQNVRIVEITSAR